MTSRGVTILSLLAGVLIMACAAFILLDILPAAVAGLP